MSGGVRRALGVPVLLIPAAFRLARFAVAIWGAAALLGVGWALVLAALVAAARLNWAVRIMALVTAVWLWRWPPVAALLFAVPRLLLLVPGLAAMLTARIRHPRPLWSVSGAARDG
jgi:hypothetical protein